MNPPDRARNNAAKAQSDRPTESGARARSLLGRGSSRDGPADGEWASYGFADVPRAEKVWRVRSVFDRAAGKYDLMNDLMSLGTHRIWKDAAMAWVNPQPGELLVDVAGGTGDLSRRFLARARHVAKRTHRAADARAIVLDINAAMLSAGRHKPASEPDENADSLFWVCGNGEMLPLPDRCADAVTIGFGIRNVTDIAKALAEMRRILKPGGRFACLEFSKPNHGVLQSIYDAFSFRVIPLLGERIAGDGEPYQYLVESIRRFPDQERFAAMISEAGFARVAYSNFSGGIAALHHGWAI